MTLAFELSLLPPAKSFPCLFLDIVRIGGNVGNHFFFSDRFDHSSIQKIQLYDSVTVSNSIQNPDSCLHWTKIVKYLPNAFILQSSLDCSGSALFSQNNLSIVGAIVMKMSYICDFSLMWNLQPCTHCLPGISSSQMSS